MITGTQGTGHSKAIVFPWATGTTLKAALDTTIAARGTTWAALLDSPSPMLRMPAIYIYPTVAGSTLGDGVNTFPLVHNGILGPLDLTDPATLTYTGASSASVMMLI